MNIDCCIRLPFFPYRRSCTSNHYDLPIVISTKGFHGILKTIDRDGIFLQEIKEAIKTNGAKRVIFSGYSLGGAVASLAQAFAARGQLKEAWRYYKQLRRTANAVEEACSTHRRMFEALIEQNCRCGRVDRALIVFDDWKAASAAWFVKKKDEETPPSSDSGASPLPLTLQPASSAAKKKQPKLSNVSLAFLEACCQNTPAMEWRVYDVCSVMRMQKERKVQESLARPQKASHHVLGSVQTS